MLLISLCAIAQEREEMDIFMESAGLESQIFRSITSTFASAAKAGTDPAAVPRTIAAASNPDVSFLIFIFDPPWSLNDRQMICY